MSHPSQAAEKTERHTEGDENPPQEEGLAGGTTAPRATRTEGEHPEAVPLGHGLGEPTVDHKSLSEMSAEEIEELEPTSGE